MRECRLGQRDCPAHTISTASPPAASRAIRTFTRALTLENTLEGNWHNLVRYGIARKREQEGSSAMLVRRLRITSGPLPCSAPTADCFTEYFGNVVTIRGANGYTATGQASFFIPTDNQDSNRDELYYQSDYTFAPWLDGAVRLPL